MNCKTLGGNCQGRNAEVKDPRGEETGKRPMKALGGAHWEREWQSDTVRGGMEVWEEIKRPGGDPHAKGRQRRSKENERQH